MIVEITLKNLVTAYCIFAGISIPGYYLAKILRKIPWFQSETDKSLAKRKPY